MDYYCDKCDKTTKIKSPSKHLQCLSNNEFKKCVATKHTVKNLDFFHIDEKFNDYITNHNNKQVYI